jgi:hypothetical protein
MMQVDVAELDLMAAEGRVAVAMRTPAFAGELMAEAMKAALE